MSARPGMGFGSALVTAEWLAEHREEVVVIDVSIARGVDAAGAPFFAKGQAVFEAGHIPGAKFGDLFDAFSDPAAPFPFTRPATSQVEAAARALGIDDGSAVVVYDSLNGVWAARLWWVLRANGLERAAVLNGGLAGWTRRGGAVETGPAAPPARPGTFVARPRDGYFVDLAEVEAVAASGSHEAALVCGLRRSEFAGGHIPGSASLPYAELLDAEGCLDLGRVRAAWQALGFDDGRRALLYCGGGINAAGLALALTEAGCGDLAVFDGSLNEWRADPGRPMATDT